MKRIINLRSSRTRMFILSIVDIITIIVNSYLSLLIRHELHYDWIPHEYIHDICTYMVINIITTIIIFILMNLYRSVWTFAGLHEAILIVGACVLSTAFQALGMTFLVLQVPRSYYVYYCFLLILTTMVTRFSYRGLRIIRKEWGRTGQRAAYNTMVIGAGEAGSIIINELKTSGRLSSRVVCVIDDNPSKKGKYLHGVRIVGDRSTIVHFAEKYDVNEIILAIPSAKAKIQKKFCEFAIRPIAS